MTSSSKMEDTKIYNDQLISDFLQVHLFRITIAGLLGFLDRWIKSRVRRSTEDELLTAERDLWEWSKMDKEVKVSLGRRQARLTSHPLYKAIRSERLRRDYEEELLDPFSYFDPLHELSESEIRNYLIWKAEVHGTIQEWRRDKKRSLPIINRERDQLNRSDPPRDQSSIPAPKKKEARAYFPGVGKKKEKVK